MRCHYSLVSETTSWKNLKDQRDETLSTGKAEIDKLQNLRDELDNITDANGRVKTGYEERAKFITGELSEALDIEIGYKDGVVQSYEKIREEIDKTIEKKKAEIILSGRCRDRGISRLYCPTLRETFSG